MSGLHIHTEAGSTSDARLVERVRAGDHEAYGTLVERYQDRLYRHTRGMGLDHDTGLDLVQDAFIRAYERLMECRDPERFKSWIYRICRNLCLDHLKNVRRRTVRLDDLPPSAWPRTPGAAGARRSALWEAFERLPPPLREAFLLKHDAGHTYEEVAEITNASASAVKMRVHRARAILRERLVGEEETVHAGDDLAVANRL